MIAPADVTVLEFLDRFYVNKPKMAAGSANTHADYHTQVRHFTAYFQRRLSKLGQQPRDPRLSDLTEELVEGAMAWRLSLGRTAPTANKVGRVIYSLWNYAWRKRYLSERPRCEYFAEPVRVPEAWWIHEFDQIVKAARQSAGYVGGVLARLWWPALLLTIYNTGGRISAVMAIRVDWLDLRGGYIKIRHDVQKHRADQLIRLLPETAAALEALEPQRLEGVFDDWQHDRDEPPWRSLTRYYRKIVRRAGLPAERGDMFHKIRRTSGTYVAVAKGLAAAQEFLQHSHGSVTRRYIDPRMQNQASAADVLPAVSAGGPRLFVAKPAS